MSQLQQLKQQLLQISNDTRTTSSDLFGVSSQFGQATAQVERAIGGSADGTDQQLIQALQQAERQLQAANGALGRASAAVQRWAQRA